MDLNQALYSELDSNYIQINSDINFYEIFTKKKQKCSTQIPNSVNFRKGTPKYWFFNSKKSKTPIVLMKNNDKINNVEICKGLIGVKTKDITFDSVTTLLDYIKDSNIHQTRKVTMAKFSSGVRKELTAVELCKTFVENKEQFHILQEYINCPKDETIIVQYRLDDLSLPVNYKFFKASTIASTGQKNKQLIQMSSIDSENQGQEQINTKKILYKFFDNQTNQRLQLVTKNLIDFIERSYFVKVRKMVNKFIVDRNQTIYYNGSIQLFVDINPNGFNNPNSIKEEIKDGIYFEQFKLILKQQKKMSKQIIEGPIFKEDKQISQKLCKNLIIEKCQGDFCEFQMIEKNRGVFTMRKEILDEYTKYFGTKNNEDLKTDVILPYQISNQLVLRVRECQKQMIELLKKNKIYKKNSNLHYTLEIKEDINWEDEFPFIKQRKEVFNTGNLYKNIKICKNCYIVYSLAQKYFDEQLKKDLHIHEQEQALSVKKLGRIGTAKTTISKPPTAPIIHNKNNTTLQPTKIDISQTQQIVEPHKRMIQSASTKEGKFRINRPTEIKKFRVGLMPAAKTLKVEENGEILEEYRQNIEFNRLAMGFLNYRDRKEQENPCKQVNQDLKVDLQKYFDYMQMQAPKKHSLLVDTQVVYNEQKLLFKRITSSSGELRSKISQWILTQKPRIEFVESISMYNSQSTPMKLWGVNRLLNIQNLPINKHSLDNSLDIDDILLENTITNAIKLHLKYYIMDSFTSIPYIFINPPNSTKLLIFIQDMFECFTLYFHLIQPICEEMNIKLLMFNLPGQPYTIFNSDKINNNMFICDYLDQLLFQLGLTSIPASNIYMLGIGYGGFILQSLACILEQAIGVLGGVTLINSFARIDKVMKDILEKSIGILKECPSEDLAQQYINILIDQDMNKDEDEKINQITIQGRLKVIKDLLSANELSDRFGCLNTRVNIIQAFRDSLITMEQTNLLQIGSKRTMKMEGNSHNILNKQNIYLVQQSIEQLLM